VAMVPVMEQVRDKHQPEFAAVAVFVLITIVGAIISYLVGATTTDDFGIMVEQPYEGMDKAFNWLLMSIFLAAAFVATAATWAGSLVAMYLSRADERAVQTAARQRTAPVAAASKPADPLDPPHL
jgi:uncharacterized membrane protein